MLKLDINNEVFFFSNMALVTGHSAEKYLKKTIDTITVAHKKSSTPPSGAIVAHNEGGHEIKCE